MTELLSSSERQEALKHLSGWEIIEDGCAIKKTYAFETFAKAFAFMTHVALFAEKVNHHPEWTNIDNQVIVILKTHECKGLSAKDISLALHMDEAAFAFLNPCMSNHSDQVF